MRNYIEQQVSLFFKDYESEQFLLGLSGGVDSVVLFHLMKKMKLNFKAIYVHHGLSKNADSWSNFCSDLCKQNNIEYIRENVCVEAKPRQSIENEARKLRYEAYKKYAEGKYLVLGHHADDLIESMLMNFLNRAGINGLSTMPSAYKNNEYHLNILRPFLFEEALLTNPISKEMIEEYAQKENIEHIFDESNNDSKYSRNFLRNDIIPKLKDHFGNILKPMAKTNIQAQTIYSSVSESQSDEYYIFKNIEKNLYRIETNITNKSALRNKLKKDLNLLGITIKDHLLERNLFKLINVKNRTFKFDGWVMFDHRDFIYLLKESDLELTITKGNYSVSDKKSLSEKHNISLKKELQSRDVLRKSLPLALRHEPCYAVSHNNVLVSIYNANLNNYPKHGYFQENYIFEHFLEYILNEK